MEARASIVTLVATMAACVPGCGRIAFDGVGDAGSSSDTGDGPPSNIARGQILRLPGVQGTSVTTAITFTPGSVVVAIPYWNEGARTVTVADTAGQSWTAMARQSIPTGCYNNVGTAIQVFVAPITASGTYMLTATQSGGANWLAMFVIEYSGIATSNMVDGVDGMIAGTASNQMSAGMLSTYDVIIAGFHDTVGMGTMIAGPGLTQRSIDTSAYALLADAIVPAGSYTIIGSLPSGVSDACWVATAVALRAQ